MSASARSVEIIAKSAQGGISFGGKMLFLKCLIILASQSLPSMFLCASVKEDGASKLNSYLI